MHRLPDATEISETAETIGATIGAAEAELYRPHLVAMLRLVDEFMQSRTVESPPPMLFPERSPGYRPGFGEDTHRAWMWRCDVGGADTGLLAEYQSVGFAGRLAKPFSLRDLAVTLHDLLAEARRHVPQA